MNSTWTATCVYVTAVLLHVCFVNSIAEAEPLLDSTPAFRIPPQPLPSALAQFSEQCGVQVTSSAALVEQKPSKGVAGRIDARAALKKLLEGTGLEFEVIDGETVVIVPARVKAAPRPTEQPLTDVKNERGISEGHEVLVTGSHIRTTRSSASPVFSFDQQDFLDSGTTSIQAFMRTVPQNFNGGRTEASAAVSDYRHGGRDNLTQGSGINIRGLGNESTLVLLNGRRLAPGGFGAFYDVSTIPLSAVERIDVLADGSSAIYGSDAIGGVVNIILRNKFDGAQTTLGYGGVTHGDLRELTANQLFGTELDRGSILLNLDYAHRDPLRAKDRNFAHRIWTGSNDLLPEERRLSGLISAHQEITSTLRVSLDAYATDREADSDHSPVGLNNQMHTQAETKHVGGTAELIWTAPIGWEVELGYTYSSSDGDRLNDLGNNVRRYTRVGADLGVSATELKAYGPVFPAPGGLSSIAIGIERRRESMDVTRDNIPGTAPRISRNRTVDAGYAELQVPLIGTDDPLRESLLEVSGALRYERYSDVGTTDNAKLSATWSPFHSIDLHTSWGTSFRAPSLYQFDPTFGTGMLLSVPNAESPRGYTLIAIAAQAPHPNLGPETATTWTAGISIAPGLIGTWRMSGNYFRVDYDNRIAAPLPTLAPFSNPSLRPLITIPADPEVLDWIVTAPSFYNLSTQRIDEVEATLDVRTNNLSAARISGIDLMLANDFQTDLGTITTGVNANYLLAFDTWVTESWPSISILNTVFNPPDFRARGQLRWANASWSASASVNYVDDYVDNQLPQPSRVNSWTTLDLNATYSFSGASQWTRGLTLRANVSNAANKAPPHIRDRGGAYGDPGYDTQNASPLGRFISLEISKTW